MASIQKLKLISDIELQLNQGTISDDSELDRRQIAFWIDYELGQLIRQECDTCVKLGKQIPPIYLVTDGALVLQEDMGFQSFPGINSTGSVGPVYFDNTTGDYYKWSTAGWVKITKAEAAIYSKNTEHYISLNNSVMDLFNDNGIVRVSTDEGDLIYKSTTTDLDTLKHLRFAGPSDETLVWYRRDSTSIYIKGLTTSDIRDNYFNVTYVIKPNFSGAGDNAYFNVSDAILPILIDRVVQRGKLQLYGTTPDVANDGIDYKQPVYHTAVSNPTRGDQQAQQQQQ